jgi:putative phage-type endonuclease
MNKFIGIKQGTDEWLKIRQNKLTATNIASILNMNVYESRQSLIEKKVNNESNMITNNAIEHGKFFEDVAKNIYEKKTNNIIFTPGLIEHPLYNWLAASPDGIVENSHLVEFKCYYTKKISDSIPINYWIQMQIQMEVCNYDKCDFVECIIKKIEDKVEYKNEKNFEKGIHKNIYWKLYDFKITAVNRDSNWFKLNLPIFDSTWKYIEKLKTTKSLRKRKRETDDIDLNSFYYYKEIDNYIQNDLIIHYFQLNNYKKDISSFHLQNKERSYILINKIIAKLENAKVITNLYEKVTIDKHNQTINEIKNKKHNIIGGVLFDFEKKIYCKYNLLLLGKNISNKLESDIYYPVQIINRKIPLLKKTNKISNDNNNKKYKGRSIILSDILNKYQKNQIKCSYIIDSNFLLTNEYIKLDYISYSNNHIKNAFNLYNLIKNNFDKIDIYNPEHSYIKLIPNMKNQNPFWSTEKNKIASKINPISLIWNCGINIQNELLKQNIYSYREVNTINYITPSTVISLKQKQIINKIIDINKQKDYKILPNSMLNINNWIYDNKIEFYVDFETTTLLNSDKVLYLIGLGVSINNNWDYYSFCIDINQKDAEKDLVLRWINKMNEIKSKNNYNNIIVNTWHWSYAEKSILNNIFKRYSDISIKIYWNDLQEIFMEEKIVIKNCYNYKLKSIVNALYSHNLIKTNYNNIDCNNGIDALVDGYQCYKSSTRMNIPIEYYLNDRDIILYNKIDCYSLFEILQFLRQKYKK